MRLRVLTLNVWGLPPGLARHREIRMRAIGERFIASAEDDSSPDVIALQEVWTRGARQILVAAGRRAGYNSLWHREAAFGGSGLLVMSRLPILRADFTQYRLAGLPQRIQHADYYGGKGFASLDLDTPLGPVSLITSHLHANYSPRIEEDEYIGIRAAQVVELAAHIHGLDTPVVALGDFNTREGEAAYEILLGLSGLRDLAVELDRRQATCMAPHPYRQADAEAERIDLILSRRGRGLGIREQAIERRFDETLDFEGAAGSYSDHAGVFAELEIASDPLAAGTLPGPPLDPRALELAAVELAAGRALAVERRQRESSLATPAIATGLLLGGAAWRIRRSRRRFLSALTSTLASLGLGGGLAALLGSRHVVAGELEGYREIEKILADLRKDAEPQGSGAVRIGAP